MVSYICVKQTVFKFLYQKGDVIRPTQQPFVSILVVQGID